ncbi:helix-turn-helix domain-containing protein [Rhodococcus sp. IEGM 1381]|uniref:helix-turn-helix domain-containing protein n=1 Tax=Rhodococcus sp. IEGM 1381 TaxID=3047085 RepID=UPI0024B749E5|nr:helix-turn-helix domain-containing protein [Rhodococcus sp. IEGM 1381]MDI9893178.1 helix-turn-helix domain-containing protein [Rhodococcus sp. IEGM 1381]
MLPELGVVRRVIAAIDRPTWLVGSQGTIDAINPAALKTLGYRSDDDVLGHNSHGTFHHSHIDGTVYDESKCPLLRPCDHGSPRDKGAVEWLIRRNGSTFAIEWSTRAVELDGVKMMIVAIDDASIRPDVSMSAVRYTGQDVALPDPGRTALFKRISNYMAFHSCDPHVTPTSAAHTHNISIRLLQNLFAEHGDSPARYLRRCRAERAAQSLVDGASTQDACVLAGFGDESTFRRAFRDRFGTAPSAYLARQ